MFKMEEDELFTNGVVLIVLSVESKIEDGPVCSEEDEYMMPIMIDYDI
jgi:hypothetical protein